MKRIDPITLSVVRNSLATVGRQVGIVVEKTSQSFLTSELHDYSVGLFDGKGRAVATLIGLPAQAGAGNLTMKAAIEKFGSDFSPGDVILQNDPYLAKGTHLPDWTYILPVFHKGELVFFIMLRAHQFDAGGAYPGGYFPAVHDIYSEGVRIEPTKIYKKGEEQEIFKHILNNVRLSDKVRMDGMAAIAALKKGAEVIEEVLNKYGKDEVFFYIEEMIVRGEEAMRREIEKMPDGVYHGEAATDDDGTILDKPIWVRCKIEIRGNEITIDFSDSDKQANMLNSPIANTQACVYSALFMCIDPKLSEYVNEGSFRPIKIEAPEGSCVNPTYPATVGGCPVALGMQIFESVHLALGKAIPEKVCAPWARHYGNFTFGIDPRKKEPYVFVCMNGSGGSGASWGFDGWPHIAPITAGGRLARASVEMLEIEYPWQVVKYELLTDSSGAGRWRGGLGMDWRMKNVGLECGLSTGNSCGERIPMSGIEEGKAPPLNRQHLLSNEKMIEIRAKRMYRLKPGDILVQNTGGGCGIGDPGKREIEKVREDVKNGFVSPQAAEKDYKVVFNSGTFEVDEDATRKLRTL